MSVERENSDSLELPPTRVTIHSDVFGTRKTLGGLGWLEWVFLLISCSNIFIAIGLTLERLFISWNDPYSFDFTYSLLLLISCFFCVFYVFNGVLRERQYEIYAFTAAVLLVLVYCILEYSLYPSGRNVIKLARLIVGSVLAPVNVVMAVLVARRFGWLEFRIVGAAEALQQMYRQLCFYLSLQRFDVQAALSFTILVLRNGREINIEEILTLSIGIPLTIIGFIVGYIAVVKEYKWLVWIFILLNFIQPTYIIYKISVIYLGNKEMRSCFDDVAASCIHVYSIIGVGFFAFLVRAVLLFELLIVYRNFGFGLNERDFANLVSERTSLLGRARNSF
ncbi:hypothetical protein CHUAL_002757 [Chamberlinius hualienensis]